MRTHESHAEKEDMQELKNEIFSYLIAQTGILPGMMRRHPSLGKRIVAWLVGEKPVLLIGGEPGSGKSLCMGELALRHHELVKLYPDFQSHLALISYDRVHYLFLKYLAQVDTDNVYNFLPEGETYPEARKLITKILQDMLVFAMLHLPQNTSIILEAPLIDHRGEDIVADLSVWNSSIQVFIIHSPAMQFRVLQEGKRQTREMSASTLAIRQIHNTLLRKREITSLSQHAQNDELIKSWEQWLWSRDGLVLSWDPDDDEAGFVYLRETLKAKKIPSNPLTPLVLNEYAISLIKSVLGTIPNLEAFAIEVKRYGL